MEWDFSKLDWPSLVIGALLSIPAGLIAGWLYGRISSMLESSKLYVSTQRKNTVLREMSLVDKFKSGERSLFLWGIERVLVLLVLVASGGSATVLLLVPTPELISVKEPLFIVLVLLCFAIARFILREFGRVKQAYDNWEKYQSEAKEKFGVTVENARQFGTEEKRPIL